METFTFNIDRIRSMEIGAIFGNYVGYRISGVIDIKEEVIGNVYNNRSSDNVSYTYPCVKFLLKSSDSLQNLVNYTISF
jgi:hypothetical protein